MSPVAIIADAHTAKEMIFMPEKRFARLKDVLRKDHEDLHGDLMEFHYRLDGKERVATVFWAKTYKDSEVNWWDGSGSQDPDAHLVVIYPAELVSEMNNEKLEQFTRQMLPQQYNEA